jgi:hypothetical protein
MRQKCFLNTEKFQLINCFIKVAFNFKIHRNIIFSILGKFCFNNNIPAQDIILKQKWLIMAVKEPQVIRAPS